MSRFVYYNRNPNGDTIGDCVCRAISLAMNLPYEIVDEKLELTANLLDCDSPICVCCYDFLLSDVFKLRKVQGEDLTVGEFADLHPYGIFLVRVPEHLTCIIDNTVFDIWDCRNELCDIVWQTH